MSPTKSALQPSLYLVALAVRDLAVHRGDTNREGLQNRERMLQAFRKTFQGVAMTVQQQESTVS